MTDDIVSTHQICVTETKNLVAEQQTTEVLRRNETGDVKGKIIEYAWWLKKDGKSESTILGRTKILRILTKRGANLYDPETIKEAIAKQPWSNGRKNNACRRLLILPKNGRRQMGSTTIPNHPKTTLHPKRNRNRPAHRRMQQTHGNIPTNAKRNRRKMRRNLATKMGRHRLRKQSRKHNTRKEQQPTRNPPKQQTPRNAQTTTKKLRRTESFPTQTCESTTTQ